MTSQPILIINLVFALAGFVQGLTGFGLALVAVPLLGLLIDLKFVVPLCVLHGLIVTGYLSLRLRPHVRWHRVMPLLLGSLPGVLLGVAIFKQVDLVMMKILLGLLVAAYGCYSLVRKNYAQGNLPVLWGYLAGFGTGVIGTVFSAGGPPAIIYTTLSGWHKDVIKATLSAFFFTNGVAMATGHWWAGITTMAVVRAWALTLPGLGLGLWLGALLYDHVDHRRYLRLVAFGLVVMGLMLMADALL